MLRYHVKESYQKNKKWYILTFLFTILCCALFQKTIDHIVNSGSMEETTITWQSNLLYMLGGIPEIKVSMEKTFEIPFIWMTIQLIVIACGFMGPFHQGSTKDVYILMKSESKSLYIGRQIFVSLMQVLMVYISIILGTLIYTIFCGDLIGEVNIDVFQRMYGVYMHEQISIGVILFPVLYSIMVTMVQLCLNMFIGRVLSMVVLVGYDVLSTYVTSSALLGNLSILYRNKYVVEGGLHVEIGVIVCILVLLVSAILTNRKFQTYDIL